jgi:hypothetical protein
VPRGIRLLTLCGLLTACAPGRAFAEWQLAPFVGFSFLGETNLNVTEMSPRHWNIGATARLLGGGPLGVEALFLYVPGAFQSLELDPISLPSEPTITESLSLALMGNLVLTTPRTWNEYGLRPYVSGGFGLMHAWHDEQSFPARANVPGYNVGGGAVGFLSDRVGLRFDLRFFRTLPPGAEPNGEIVTNDGVSRLRIQYWTGTVGVVFKY